MISDNDLPFSRDNLADACALIEACADDDRDAIKAIMANANRVLAVTVATLAGNLLEQGNADGVRGFTARLRKSTVDRADSGELGPDSDWKLP